MTLRVSEVDENSIGAELGVAPGDWLLSIDGERVVDYLDYLALTAGDSFTMVFRRDGQELEAEVEKDDGEDMGLAFAQDGFGPVRRCANRCVFCFVDQLPRGMRDSLYVKDDDWRMSLVMGNYITLTNVGEREFARLLRRRPSPMYISVHATDDDARERILRQRRGRGILERLERMAEAGIQFHCQTVVAPGYNDGAVLEQTIEELQALYPAAASLAVVPLGMTGHREGLAPLEPVDQARARAMVEIVEAWQARCLQAHGTRFVFGADELYIKAGLPFPAYEAYEEFGQIGDGVGLCRSFIDDAKAALAEAEEARPRKISLATGVDAAPFIGELADLCREKFGIDAAVYAIRNDFFGESITVCGLLTGRDLLAQLKGKDLGETLLLSRSMLRHEENVFLDDMTLEELSAELGVACITVPQDGYEFIRAVLGA